MSDDSDHAGSPAQRAKRQKTDGDEQAVPILAFDSMGPDETTADFSHAVDERSTEPLPRPEAGSVIRTTEELDRLQTENVRLRIELDELRKQLHAVHEGQEQLERRDDLDGGTPSTRVNDLETRIVDLATELALAKERNQELVEQGRDSRTSHDLEAEIHRNAEKENEALRESNSKLQEANNSTRDAHTGLLEANERLEKDKSDLEARLQAAESEIQRMQSVAHDLQNRADIAGKDRAERDELRSRISGLERELQNSYTLQSRVDELETANATLRLTVERKQEQLLSMQHHNDVDAKLNEENEELKDMLVDLGVRDHERAHDLQVLSVAKDELSTKLADTEAELEKARAENHRQAEKTMSLQTEAKSAELHMKETARRISMLEEAIELKESQNTELRDEVHRFTVRDKEQAQSLQHLKLQQDHLQRLNEDFKQRLASQDIEISEQRAEIRTLHRQCTEQAQSLEEVQRERHELESLAQSRARALEERERRLAELTQKSEQLQTTVTQLEDVLATKSEQVEKQAEAAWQQRRAMEEELKRIQNEHSHELEVLKHDHNEELANQLGMQQRVVDEVKSREAEASEKHEKQLQKLRAQVASLRAEAATSESEHNTAKALLDDTRAQLNQTLQALEELQARTTEERTRHSTEKHRLERHSGELEARSSRLQTELDELRRKDKAMDERIQKLEQTLVDQSVELRQLKTPALGDSGQGTSSQDSVSEVESLRREFATQGMLWERMRDEMVDYINRINGENSSLRAELDRWRNEEAQRAQAMEDSLKRNFIKQAEQLESLASFKEDAQNSLVSVAQEDVRKLTQENLAMRREHAALYERAETLEIHASQASAELSRTTERLNAVSAQLNVAQEEDEHLRQELKHANELIMQSQTRISELEKDLKLLDEQRQQKSTEAQDQLDQLRLALQASEATAKNLRINAEVMESQHRSQAEAAVKYVDMLFFIMKVDRRRIQDLTFVKKHLMLYFPPPVGVFPVKDERAGGRRRTRTMYEAATFALAVVRLRRGQQNGSRVLALEYEKQLRTMQ